MDEWFLSLNLSWYWWFDPGLHLTRLHRLHRKAYVTPVPIHETCLKLKDFPTPQKNGPMDMGKCLFFIWQRLCIQLHFCWYPQSPNRRALGGSTVGVFGCNFWWCQVGKSWALQSGMDPFSLLNDQWKSAWTGWKLKKHGLQVAVLQKGWILWVGWLSSRFMRTVRISYLRLNSMYPLIKIWDELQ